MLQHRYGAFYNLIKISKAAKFLTVKLAKPIITLARFVIDSSIRKVNIYKLQNCPRSGKLTNDKMLGICTHPEHNSDE